MNKFVVAAVVILSGSVHAFAQTANNQGTTGSSNVIIEGQQAKRAGDLDPADEIHSPNVFINGKPAVVGCRTGIPVTAKSVFVNGKPKVLGCRKR